MTFVTKPREDRLSIWSLLTFHHKFANEHKPEDVSLITKTWNYKRNEPHNTHVSQHFQHFATFTFAIFSFLFFFI
jgi:hypothetical protein